jgi:hypothetical protein
MLFSYGCATLPVPPLDADVPVAAAVAVPLAAVPAAAAAPSAASSFFPLLPPPPPLLMNENVKGLWSGLVPPTLTTAEAMVQRLVIRR